MQAESKFIQSIKAFLDFHVAQSGNQKKLAEQCGVNPANISRWLSDDPEKRRIPRMEDFAPVLDYFGITLAPDGMIHSDCPNCKDLKDKIKHLTSKNEALLEAISAQAAAQSKPAVELPTSMHALCKEQKS